MTKKQRLICIKDRYSFTTYTKEINSLYQPYWGPSEHDPRSSWQKEVTIFVVENESSGTHTYMAPKWSSVNHLLKTLEILIRNNQADQLKNLLVQNYIFDVVKTVKKSTSHSSRLYTLHPFTETHEYTYLSCITRPNIEMLVLHETAFRDLLQIAKTQDDTHGTKMRTSILQTLGHLQLKPNECANFANLDLSGAIFSSPDSSRTLLGCSDFTDAKTDGVYFYNCDLSNCKITQDQLDSSHTYERARVPTDCWGYWDKQCIASILKHLTALKTHAETKIPLNDPKYKVVMNLYETYQPILANGMQSITSNIKQHLFDSLLDAQTNHILAKHRNYRFLIGEMLACILTGVVPYFIMAAYKYRQTKHFGLFACPTSHEKLLKIKDIIDEKRTPSDRSILSPSH